MECRRGEGQRAGCGNTFQNSRDGPRFLGEIHRQSLARTMTTTLYGPFKPNAPNRSSDWLSRGAGTGDSELNADIKANRFAFVKNTARI